MRNITLALMERMRCTLCASSDTNCLQKGIYDSDTTNLFQCNLCGVQFIYPLMTIEEEEEYYKDYYTGQQVRYAVGRNLEDIQQNSYVYHLQNINVYKSVINKNSKVLERKVPSVYC